MNLVVLCGNLTKDGELRATKDGNSIFNFTLAVRRSYAKEGQEDVDFINCSSYGKLADNMSKYTKKGSKVLVQGKLQIRCYQDKDGNNRYTTSIIVDTCTFLNKKEDTGSNNVAPAKATAPEPENDINDLLWEDGDLPF